MSKNFSLVFVFLFCIVCVLAHGRGHALLDHLNHDDHHHHYRRTTPVSHSGEECEGRGVCVQRIQCPAILRAQPTVCHIGGHVGVCCTTGQYHASESDRNFASHISPSTETLRLAHRTSEERLKNWTRTQQRVETGSNNGTVLSRSSPSYGHFMSVRTHEIEKEETLGRGALRNLFAAQTLKMRDAITEDQLRLAVSPITNSPFCPLPPACETLQRYRHIGGECNNIANTGWGSSQTAYERILPPNYSDDIWSIRMSVTGLPLPSARTLSDSLLLDIDNPSTAKNLMLSQFGQFIVHDITAGVTFRLANGSPISCCTPDGSGHLPPELQHEGCAAIDVLQSDPFYSQFQMRCMNFVRTQLAPSHDCSLGHAKQMNGVTHFTDLSTIYGSSESKLAELKEPNGRMRTFVDFGRELPPISSQADDCLMQQEGAACFNSGDGHINELISLVSVHTLFIREHNRLLEALAHMNPTWPPDVLFLEARRILIAQYQHIIYNEWLPLVIGPQTMAEFHLTPRTGGEYSTDYSADINPSVTNEAAAAAMRFGHSTVDSKIMVPQPKRLQEEIFIPELMFQPSRMRLRQFHDRLLTGLSWQPMQSVDPFITEALTRYMFHGGQPFGMDLAAINIQRGRDHGLRSYNDYLTLIGSKRITNFSQFSNKAAERLSSVYSSPDDIDLWIGGLMEPPLPESIVGSTFAHIIADQFSRLRRGDRHFYEHGPDVNPEAFTKDQLVEIRKASISRLVCDNSDGIELFAYAPHGFLLPSIQGNNPVPCNSDLIPSIDLSKFSQV